METFQFGRFEGFPSRYSPNKTPVTVDVTETILIAVFIIITIAYFCIIPGYSKKRSIHVTIQVVVSVTIGCLLIVENFGQEWEIGHVRTVTPYRAGTEHKLNSSIGVKIGLRSVNITLKGEAEKGSPLAKEIINYNERFWWTWDQGRFGFGPYAGLLQRSLREAQRRGLPIPILWVAEYFAIDGEGIRFGRFYRTAGWYSHILLWTAFACWLLANLYLQSTGRYAAYLIALTGGLQILVCIVWISVHNPTPLVIPFGNKVLEMRLGTHFIMTLICGILCLLLASAIIFMDLRYPDILSTFLGINPLNQYDECIIRASELKDIQNTNETDNTMEMSVTAIDASHADQNTSMMVLKRKSINRNVRKSFLRPPIPVQTQKYDDVSIHENENITRQPLAPSVAPSHSKPKNEDFKPPIPKKVKRIKVVP